MYNQDKIKIKNHLNYIDSLAKKKDKIYFLIKQDIKLIGVINFTSIDFNTHTAEIGLYSNPNLNNIGKLLMNTIIEYGFNYLKLNKLFAHVFISNTKAIKLYKQFNFLKYKEDTNMIYMELENSRFNDLI